jgi:hypothetical protein
LLTTQEQDEVIKFVKKIIRNDRNRRSRLAKYSISEKAAKESEKRDYEELRYVLKDLG